MISSIAGVRSALAVEHLQKMGWRDVTTRTAGDPVERGGNEQGSGQ